ncbi:MAG: hypothetical protein N2C14_13640, partial [Planctomycetales bacterium]
MERLLQALPLIAERAKRLAALQESGDAVLLPADFRERRMRVENGLRVAQRDCKRTEQGIEKLEREISGLRAPRKLLDRRERIEQIHGKLDSYRLAQEDLPLRENELENEESQAESLLRKLGLDPSREQADPPRTPQAKRLRIRTLGGRKQVLVEQVENGQARSAELKSREEKLASEAKKLPSPRDAGPLSAALVAARKRIDLEERLADSQRELRRSEQQADVDLQKLPLWNGTLEELESAPVPGLETSEDAQDQFAEIDREARDLQRRTGEQQQRLAECDRELARQRLEQAPPSEGDLDLARALRDASWNQIREAWKNWNRDPDQVQQAAALGDEEAGAAAEAFERRVKEADEIADRLRREADRVGLRARLESDRKACEDALAQLQEATQTTKSRRAAADREWHAAWKPAGIEPGSPREMLGWSRQARELIRRAGELRSLREKTRQENDLLQSCRRGLSERLGEFATVSKIASLSELVSLAEASVQEVRETEDRRNRLAAELERAGDERRRVQAALGESLAKQAAWQAEWTESISGLPLPKDAEPNEAEEVLELINELAARREAAAGLHNRIEKSMRPYLEDFEKEIGALAAAVAPDLADDPAGEAAAELNRRLVQAVSAENSRLRMLAEKTEENAERDQAGRRLGEHQLELESLCREAECESPDALPEAEKRSERKRESERELKRAETRLFELSLGEPLPEFIGRAQAQDADALKPRVERLTQSIDELNRELKGSLGERIGAEKKILEQMDSSADAADDADHASDLVAKIGSAAEDYARLKLAMVVLRRGVDRYRERRQGPILHRAGELFRRLTVDSFAGLRVDYNADGEPELVGVRAGGQAPLGVGGMSDGSADQLYFALRLAWLENYLENHEAVPFIVDDVLIQFDDDRALETLKALVELSRRTQVLFFTHHRHLVEIARDAIDSDCLFTHELPASRQVESS